MRKLAAGLIALAVAFSAAPSSADVLTDSFGNAKISPAALGAPPSKPDPQTFVIFHTNDIHGQLAPRPANPTLKQNATGGIASLSTLLKSERRPWLWIDSGDWAQGTPLGSLSKGHAVIPFFNRLGLSASVIGNHDYDWGEGNLYELLSKANFKFVGHNIHVNEKDYGYEVRPHDEAMNGFQILRPVEGFEIGLIGLLSPDTPKMLAAGRMAYSRVDGVLDSARYQAAALRSYGVNMIVAVTHIGIEKTGDRVFKLAHEGDLALAEAVPEINMILGGHVHVNVVDPYVRTNDGRTVVVTQTEGMLRNVYKIEVTFDRKTKALLEAKATLVPLDPAVYPPDPDILALLAKAEEDLGPELTKVVGRAAVDLPHEQPPKNEIPDVTPMGAIVTDAIREAAGAEIALAGSFGVRSAIKAGDITYKDVFMVAPFENSILKFRIKGADLRKYLEGCETSGAYRCQYSGIEAIHGPSPDGKRALLSATVNGEPLDDERLYTGAIDSFNAQYLPLRDKETLPEIDRDILAAYIRKHSPLVPAGPRAIRR